MGRQRTAFFEPRRDSRRGTVACGGCTRGQNHTGLNKLATRPRDFARAGDRVEITWESRGFGFVEFKKKEDAMNAIEGLNGKELVGKKLSVEEAVEKR